MSFTQEPSFYAKGGAAVCGKRGAGACLPKLSKSHRQGPDNVEYKLALAGVLSDMERYEEANQWLLRLTKEINPVPGRACEFGIGYNYLCMQEYEVGCLGVGNVFAAL